MRPFELHHEPRHLLPTAKGRPSTPNPVSGKEPENLRHYLETFNVWLEEQCRKRQSAILHGHTETIGERLQRDLAAMRVLPAAPFEVCAKATGRVSSQSLLP